MDKQTLERRIEDLDEAHGLMRTEVAQRGGAVPPQLQVEMKKCGDELAIARNLLAAQRQGHPLAMPEPGAKYLVATSGRDIKQRGRCGLRFEHRARRTVEVVNATDKEVDRRVKAGESIATPAGMLEILADDGLSAMLSSEAAAADTVSRTEHEQMLAARDARIAELEAAAAAARRGAADPNDGSPARLKAGAAARAKAEAEAAAAADTKVDEKK